MYLQPKWLHTSTCVYCLRRTTKTKQLSRLFSTTDSMSRQVRMRREMFQWLARVGRNLRDPLENSTNYLGAYSVSGNLRRVEERTVQHTRDVEKIRMQIKNNPALKEEKEEELRKLEEEYSVARQSLPPASRRDMMPFPANKDFISEPVLGPWLQNEIWKDITEKGFTIREVSSLRGVEMSRVAAVVRLLEVEKNWKKQGIETADVYAESVLELLPYTGRAQLLNWSESDEEALNEARINARSTCLREIREREEENARRERASLTLLPPAQPMMPDDLELKRRIIERRRRGPHESINDLPILKSTGAQLWLPVPESRRFTRADAAKAFDDRLQPAEKRIPHPELIQMHKHWLAGKSLDERTELQDRWSELERKKISQRQTKQALMEDSVKKITNKRGVVFRFQEIKVDNIGKDGRGPKGVGCRYGVPSMDRSKGHLKIPQHTLAPPRYMPKPKMKVSRQS
ncbi:putative tyrosine phosphatase protein [Golovinomyces cichoracearum]|uniref:Putative tyrosine phosphatase protein n=1 Tax=Golovinomyces cichoracearum TaxID=62708 RepID=A0A420HBX8_9PEZI|nr:putative tyrosine phosphatase protein [Golovinomyces cichoracearum]